LPPSSFPFVQPEEPPIAPPHSAVLPLAAPQPALFLCKEGRFLLRRLYFGPDFSFRSSLRDFHPPSPPDQQLAPPHRRPFPSDHASVISVFPPPFFFQGSLTSVSPSPQFYDDSLSGYPFTLSGFDAHDFQKPFIHSF